MLYKYCTDIVQILYKYCTNIVQALNRNVIFKNYNMVARVVAGFHQLSYFQLHCGGASGGDGLHEHNLVV